MRAAVAGFLLVISAARLTPGGAQRGGPSPHPDTRLRVVLVGDSTVTDGAGWGLGFRRFVTDRIEVVNAAVNGRSSKSYLAEGRWTQALALKGDYYLIQFGHNDEPGKGPERETDPSSSFPTNISRYVDEARAIGATPVLVTPLARRTFKDGRLTSTLTAYIAAVKAVAAAKHVPLVDLDRRSTGLVEQLGDDAWAALSPRTADGYVDRTHLNAKGSVATARLVVEELRRACPALAPDLRAEPASWVSVAADGSGDYTTVQAAIDAAPQNTSATEPWIVFVRAGTYRELLYVQREKHFVALVGEDPARTIVTFDLHASIAGANGKPIGTFRTPTVTIDADDFSAENLTFENSAGPVGQAVAVRVDGDRVVFRNCRFLGWQDTLLLNRGRQFVERSFVAGHVDFIFGGATTYFDRCHVHAWRDGYITAASTPLDSPFGFVFADGRITGGAGAATYLGRPWRDFANVTFLRTEMGDVVKSEGWHNWDRPERERTTRYREFGSTGPGAHAGERVAWAKTLTRAEEANITPSTVLAGADNWDPLAVPSHPSMVRVTDLPIPPAPGVP